MAYGKKKYSKLPNGFKFRMDDWQKVSTNKKVSIIIKLISKAANVNIINKNNSSR
jgi:hypothetical protein